MPLFSSLRQAGLHRKTQIDPMNRIDESFDSNEMGGECGEAMNIVKKLARIRLGIKTGSKATEAELIGKLSYELADVLICVDKLAGRYNIDLKRVVREKFNEKSVEWGVSTRLEFTDDSQL